MFKKYKILSFASGIFLLLVISFVIFSGLKSTNTSSGPNNSKIPDYVLSKDEEGVVSEFVKNFVSLYNTYSFNDYSNIVALGDYESQNFYQISLEYVKKLEREVPEGYSVKANPVENTFSYKYASKDKLQIEIKSQRVEVNTKSGVRKMSEFKSNMSLVKLNNKWVVDSYLDIE